MLDRIGLREYFYKEPLPVAPLFYPASCKPKSKLNQRKRRKYERQTPQRRKRK